MKRDLTKLRSLADELDALTAREAELKDELRKLKEIVRPRILANRTELIIKLRDDGVVLREVGEAARLSLGQISSIYNDHYPHLRDERYQYWVERWQREGTHGFEPKR